MSINRELNPYVGRIVMACPFIDEVVDEGAIIIRRAFQRERTFRDRADPLAFCDNYLHERYRFSREGIAYICRLLSPHIANSTRRNKALTLHFAFLPAENFVHSWRCRQYQQSIGLPLCTNCVPVFKKMTQCVHHLPWPQSDLYY